MTHTAENDAPWNCDCALRCVGHTHDCVAKRLEQVERALVLLTRVIPPEVGASPQD